MIEPMKQPIDLEGIRARERAATPGPWCISEKGNTVKSLSIDGICHGMSPKQTDAEFIAHARQDIPALLDALDKKDAEISKLSQDVEHLRALLDRAVEEIKRFGSCQACGHNAPSEKYPVLGECEFGGCNGGGRGSIEEDRWQWRGFSEKGVRGWIG